jgi:hypothetical protein
MIVEITNGFGHVSYLSSLHAMSDVRHPGSCVFSLDRACGKSFPSSEASHIAAALFVTRTWIKKSRPIPPSAPDWGKCIKCQENNDAGECFGLIDKCPARAAVKR